MGTINTSEVNNRLIKNEKFVHRLLAKPLRQILSITPEQLKERKLLIGDGWMVNNEPIIGELTNFTGIIDLETTGLIAEDQTVICAVGIGFIDDNFVVVSHGRCKKLPIKYSTVFNWNQPFDRTFYHIENGKDTNAHIDLTSMAKMVYGTPTHSSYGFHGYIPLSGMYEYFFGIPLDKSDRDLLISNQLSFEDTVMYCLRDVIATVKVAQKIIPPYVNKNPSPISLNGIKLRSFSIPISDKFKGWHEKVEVWYQDQIKLLQTELEQAAITALTSELISHKHLFEQYPESLKTDN